MKARKAAVRATPALLMLVTALLAGNLGLSGPEWQAKGWGKNPLGKVAPPVSPLTPQEFPCSVAEELIGISEQAATLTGSLAVVEKDERSQAAAKAAQQIHTLRQRAAGLPEGAELAWVLGDLAEALEKYAGGDPSAIGNVRETSARNAGVRQVLKQQQLNCGGQTDE